MAWPGHALAVLLGAALLGGAGQAAAGALFSLSDDGRTFLYEARPGDHPGRVAEMFGIAPHEIGAFLTANGISDATRVSPGFVYRIPNRAVDALTERAAALQAENGRLTRETAEAVDRAASLARELADAQQAAAAAAARAARAARVESLWPVAQAVIIVLVLVAGATATVATAAVRRHRQAERYARTLAIELEEKRKANLLERQERTRASLELENRVRALEAQLGPRVLIGGRGS